MADLEKTRTAPLEQLFEEIGRIKAGMLGVSGHDAHMVPMSPQAELETKKIWFFTQRSRQLVANVGMGNTAHFCMIGKDHDFHAFLSGPIVQNTERAAIDRHWNTMTSAWFPGGKDDPNLSLLEFSPNEATIWASTDSTTVFAWEIAKALATGSEPHLGESVKIAI